MRKSVTVLPLALLCGLFADGFFYSAHAQCAASDKIYIDPRLVPRRPQISRETLETILSNPYSTYGMPDLNAQILQQYQQQGQPIVIPYGTGKVLVHPTKPLHSAIYSVTESEPDVSKVPAK